MEGTLLVKRGPSFYTCRQTFGKLLSYSFGASMLYRILTEAKQQPEYQQLLLSIPSFFFGAFQLCSLQTAIHHELRKNPDHIACEPVSFNYHRSP